MKKAILPVMAAMAICSSAMADITVNVNPQVKEKDFRVEYGYISDMAKPRRERPAAQCAECVVTDGKFKIATLADGAAQYVIPTGDREYIVLYTQPGEELTVNLNSTNPLDYSVTGTKMMEDISKLDMESTKLMQEFQALNEAGNATAEDVQKLGERYDKLFTDYVAANPESQAVPYAVMHLEGEKFLDAYNGMTPAAKGSPIALFLEPQKQYVERAIEAEKRKVVLTSGEYNAPDFTLESIDGKSVSLSDFRGKWVIIDFWGSWCPWCIKGFPKLKEAYAQYKPQLEVIGVDCNEPKDAWVKAVKKYEIPWVNVYNPEQGGGKLLEEYAVEGFPTKVIVSPEGKIMNITAGENPGFFDILSELMKGEAK